MTVDRNGERFVSGSMRSAGVSTQNENAFTEGDEGEQIIANMLLAVMVSLLYSETAARAHVGYAYDVAKNLARRSVTYRPPQASKFARLSFEVGGEIEIFLVSVINDALVVPVFSSEKLRINLLRAQAPIEIVDIDLVRFTLRLRMRRIVAALEPLQNTISQEGLSQVAKYILNDCLRQEICSEDPLDRANDCFTLAHDLVGKRNYPFAALALNRANSALDAYSTSPNRSASVRAMRAEIEQILTQIRSAGM